LKKLIMLAALLAMLIVAAVPALAQIGQENEQDAQSGDVNQSFDVTGGGDNSNQCVGLQGTANTGNAQNQIGVLQYGQGGDNGGRDHHGRNRGRDHTRNGGDFEFNDVGSTITVSPTNTTDCTQAVNQAATASG
jgi:hypothetical protein